jgi:hypothetical protein
VHEDGTIVVPLCLREDLFQRTKTNVPIRKSTKPMPGRIQIRGVIPGTKAD